MGTAREGLRSAGLLAVALFAAGCATHARPSLRHAPRDPAAVAAAVSVGDLRGVSCALEGDTGRLRDTVQGMDALDGVRRSEEIWAQVELSCGDGRDIDREVARRIAELERWQNCASGYVRDRDAECRAAALAGRDADARQRHVEEAYEAIRTRRRAAAAAYEHGAFGAPSEAVSRMCTLLRAHALTRAQDYARAADVYEALRDDTRGIEHVVEAAYMAVVTREALVAAATDRAGEGHVEPCDAVALGIEERRLAGWPMRNRAEHCAEPRSGAPARAIPSAVTALMTARAAYVRLVGPGIDSAERTTLNLPPYETDSEFRAGGPLRHYYAFRNAHALVLYGRAAEAVPLLRALVPRTACEHARANFEAMQLLRLVSSETPAGPQIAAELATLPERFPSCPCTGEEPFPSEIVCGGPSLPFSRGLERFHEAERASPADAQRLYERAAEDLRAAVRRDSAHLHAPLALFYAALAYERANRFATAAHLYAYLTREYDSLVVPGSNPPSELQGDERAQRINALELSHFRAALNYERSFDYEAAVRHFGLVASDPRFAAAEQHEAHVHDALLSVAQIFTFLGDGARVAAAWRAFLPHATSAHERSLARLRTYEAPVRDAPPRQVARALRAYLRDVPTTRHNLEERAWARRRLAATVTADVLGAPFDERSLDARPALAQQ